MRRHDLHMPAASDRSLHPVPRLGSTTGRHNVRLAATPEQGKFADRRNGFAWTALRTLLAPTIVPLSVFAPRRRCRTPRSVLPARYFLNVWTADVRPVRCGRCWVSGGSGGEGDGVVQRPPTTKALELVHGDVRSPNGLRRIEVAYAGTRAPSIS
jgi:hypothetical protein